MLQQVSKSLWILKRFKVQQQDLPSNPVTDFPWLPMMLPKSQPGSIHWHNFPDTLHPPDSLIANRVAADVKISDGPLDAQGIGQRCTRWLVAKQQQKAFHLHWKTDLRQETLLRILFLYQRSYGVSSTRGICQTGSSLWRLDPRVIRWTLCLHFF